MGVVMGKVRDTGKLAELTIDTENTTITNRSDVLCMCLAMKRLGTDGDSGTGTQNIHIGVTHFVKKLKPGESMFFPNDRSITFEDQLKSENGMDYVVLVWPYDADDQADPRQTSSPEVFRIWYDAKVYMYFPVIRVIRQVSAPDADPKLGTIIGPVAAEFSCIELDQLQDTAIPDRATQAFETDRKAPSSKLSFDQVIAKEELDRDKKYFCVATWGLGPVALYPRFKRTFTGMFAALRNGTVPGCVAATGGGTVTSGWCFMKAETVTVWNERSDMANFFNSPLHQDAVAAFEGQIVFRVRRLWINASDLPDAKNPASVDAFWENIKSDRFEAATKPAH